MLSRSVAPIPENVIWGGMDFRCKIKTKNIEQTFLKTERSGDLAT